MCGISGFYNRQRQYSHDSMKNIVEIMSSTLIHRGPDAGDSWVNAEEGIAFGHRRLSIVDLSPMGNQPMHSANGRYVMVFNGEIYNFLLLRRELESFGHHFFGHSDSEIMLAAFLQWGLKGAVKRFVGMFAFAIWDRKERVLSLVRDRLGEKPLYYGWMGTSFLFGSELKALREHPEFIPQINRDVVPLYMRHNCIPAPYSIYNSIHKLLPGTILTLDTQEPHEHKVESYWNPKNIAENGAKNLFRGTDKDAVIHLDLLLRDAVAKQMVADVPLGAFLSGGIDSSTIVALMQAQSKSKVKTFTIGFHEPSYNEAEHAMAVAKHLGTEHTELYVTAEQAMDVIPSIPTLYDEPFADSSQIPTFLVAKLARQHVTVSLSGDGGDELFGGYNRYLWVEPIWNHLSWLPQYLRRFSGQVLQKMTPQTLDQLFLQCEFLLPKKFLQRSPGEKIHKFADILSSENAHSIYSGLVTHWSDTTGVVRKTKLLTALEDQMRWADLADFTQKMMYFDMITYLPDDILTKVDRACMGVSLESRVPFLDHRVVEFAWELPMSMKIRQGQSKWLLRQVLYQYVPRDLIERPKSGFGMPIGDWLRGSLREWAEELLSEKRLKTEGFFNPAPIRKKWDEHTAGIYNWQYLLWDVLMFQAWLEKNG